MVISLLTRSQRQRGLSLIEVLVTLVIVAFGLLGLVGLQARLQVSEMEAYQRSQALLLLNDMANRIATNRNNAVNYVTTAATPLGAGACPTTTANVVQTDQKEWCDAIKGASETTNSGTVKVGAMIGGLGCVEAVGVAPNVNYLVTVAWQGLTPLSAPPVGVACGANSYNATSGSCVLDRCRRVVTTLVRIGNLL